jgi:excisionase family DNA binding protein
MRGKRSGRAQRLALRRSRSLGFWGDEVSVEIVSPYWDVHQAAAYLRLKPSTVYQHASKGIIPARKHGSKLVFLKEELDGYSEKRRKVPSAAPQSKFEAVRARLRSLKTEHTADAPPRSGKDLAS